MGTTIWQTLPNQDKPVSRQLMAELSHKRFDNEFEDFETSDEIVNLQNAPVDKQRHFLRIFCVAYMLATASLIAFGDVSSWFTYMGLGGLVTFMKGGRKVRTVYIFMFFLCLDCLIHLVLGTIFQKGDIKAACNGGSTEACRAHIYFLAMILGFYLCVGCLGLFLTWRLISEIRKLEAHMDVLGMTGSTGSPSEW